MDSWRNERSSKLIMLVANPGQKITIPFIYKSGYTYIDPDQDIFIFLKRGVGSGGPIIKGPLKFIINNIQSATPSYVQNLDSSTVIERQSAGSYVLSLTLPAKLFEGMYTVLISTTADGIADTKEYNIQCQLTSNQLNEIFSPNDKSIILNSRSKYEQLNNGTTNNIILIGHTDAVEPYMILKINSIQEAINVLRADFNSPLLRGVFDAYSCGARDIFIMSCGYMNEYVEDPLKRNTKIFAGEGATPSALTFYELYQARLIECYALLESYEFIDIIVPLEASIVGTGSVNFVKQLSKHCDKIQQNTGEVQIGIIGSRTNATIEEDINELEQKNFEIESEISSGGLIEKDNGKYIILIYGEGIFNHKQMQRSYSGSAAAAFAGALASTRVDYGLAKKKIPSILSISSGNLNSLQLKRLNDLKINALVGGQRSRRNTPYDVTISGDLTQSISENYADASNVRLVAMIISELQAMGANAIGKMGYDKLIRNVDAMLTVLKSNDIVRDYSFDAYADRSIRGKIYFNISLVSVRTLRKISFNVATGRGV